jgi:hypothetical protein
MRKEAFLSALDGLLAKRLFDSLLIRPEKSFFGAPISLFGASRFGSTGNPRLFISLPFQANIPVVSARLHDRIVKSWTKLHPMNETATFRL